MTESITSHYNICCLNNFCVVALEETLFWCNGGSDENSQNLTLLKLEVLGPFLFHRPLLCDEVRCYTACYFV